MNEIKGAKSHAQDARKTSENPFPCEITELIALNSYIQEGLFITDEYGCIVYTNTTLQHLLGHSDGFGLTGKKLEEVFGTEFIQQNKNFCSNPGGNEYDANQKEIVIKFELPGGACKWISVVPHQNLHNSGTKGVVKDLTNTRFSELKWHETNVFYKTIVEISPDSITFALLDGTITDLNEKAQMLFACPDKSMAVGHSVMDFAAPEEQTRLRGILEEFIAGGDVLHIETKLMSSDGTIFFAEICAKKVPVADSPVPILMILSRDISERKSYEANLKALSMTDSLTKLLNRRGFTIAAEQELKHAKRNKAGVALFFIDVDNMKVINDSLGHETGDDALKMVAETLQSSFRNSDILARWGGDEFVVFVHDLPNRSDEMLLARMDTYMNNLNNSGKIPYEISITVGTAICEPHEDKPLSQLLKEADMQMYRNKRGR